MYSLTDDKLTIRPNFDPKIIIVAKCHYKESWQSFSAINKKDVKKIVTLKKRNSGHKILVFQVFENKSIDGFDLKTTVFDEQLIKKLGRKKILIAESELYLSECLTPYIYQVESPLGNIFSGGHGYKTKSSYAQGLLQNVATYKLSIGMPEDIQPNVIKQQDFAKFLMAQLANRSITKLIKQVSVKPLLWLNTKQLHWLYWAPLMTAFLFYVATNSYFFVFNNYVEGQLADQTQKIANVLSDKRDYDEKLATMAKLSTELSEHNLVHYHWFIIEQLFEEKMTISRIALKDNTLIIRGKADKASQLLNALSTNQYLEKISFQGQVRQSRGQESFTLAIIPKRFANLPKLNKQTPVAQNTGVAQ
jgi:hypothetical protein